VQQFLEENISFLVCVSIYQIFNWHSYSGSFTFYVIPTLRHLYKTWTCSSSTRVP